MPDEHLEPAVSDRLPVDIGGIVDFRIGNEVGNDLVALPVEIFEPLPQNVRSDPFRRQIGRNVPIGIEGGEPDVGRHLGRWIDRLPDHDAHRIHDLAVLVHEQALRSRVHDDVAAFGRQLLRPLQIDSQEIELVRLVIAGHERVAKLPIDRVHPAHLRDVRFERRRSRSRLEDFSRRWRRRFQLGVDIERVASLGRSQVPDIGNQRLAQHSVGAADCALVARPGIPKSLFKRLDAKFPRIESVELRASQ